MLTHVARFFVKLSWGVLAMRTLRMEMMKLSMDDWAVSEIFTSLR